MSFAEFRESIGRDLGPPVQLSNALAALWHDARGDWEAAHTSAQGDAGRTGAWVHAYLHRKEGDLGNAGYWYARAAQKMPDNKTVSLETEWEQIARTLLADR